MSIKKEIKHDLEKEMMHSFLELKILEKARLTGQIGEVGDKLTVSKYSAMEKAVLHHKKNIGLIKLKLKILEEEI